MNSIGVKPLLVVIIMFIIVFAVTNYTMQELLARKGNDHHGKKQSQAQQDSMCVNKSLDKILNGYLNFSDPDPISHCFNSSVNNGNGTQNNGGSNNNDMIDNSTFSNV
jgi:hypothetical protein